VRRQALLDELRHTTYQDENCSISDLIYNVGGMVFCSKHSMAALYQSFLHSLLIFLDFLLYYM
jgi:hypothetical protein